jgi:hypothetical protein
MSVCHSWFGVARSKKRGRVIFRTFFFFFVGGSIRPSSCRRLRTVSGLADKQNQRFSTSLIRWIPKLGCSFFVWMILSVTACGRRFLLLLRGCGFSASSPPSR